MKFTFGPNSADHPGLVDAGRDPSRFKTDNCDEIELDHWLWHGSAPAHYVGKNAYPAILGTIESPIDLSHIQGGLKLIIAYEGSNPDVLGDPRDYAGGTEAIRIWKDHIGPAIAAQGGVVFAITFDEPRGHQKTANRVTVADSSIRVMREIGLPVYLYEPFPWIGLDDIEYEIRRFAADDSGLFRRFVLDVDYPTITDAKWQHAALYLKPICDELGVEFAIAGVGASQWDQPFASDSEYVDAAMEWCRKIAPYTDRITVESWYGVEDQLRNTPRTLWDGVQQSLSDQLTLCEREFNPVVVDPVVEIPDLATMKLYTDESAEDFNVLDDRDVGDLEVRGVARRFGGILHRRMRGFTRDEVRDQYWPGWDQVPSGDGMRHPWDTPIGSYLYSNEGDDKFWLASQRMNQWPLSKITEFIQTREQQAATHVVYSASTGVRGSMHEAPYNCLENDFSERETVERLKHLVALDKQPLVYAMSQEFFTMKLREGKDFAWLLDQLTATTRLVAPYCKIVVPFRELSDIYDGSRMAQRNQIMRAIRKGSSDVCVAEHEGGLKFIPVDDFDGVGGKTMSLMQSGFPTPTGGQGRKEDEVHEGGDPNGHGPYDGACGFFKANGMRMYGYRDRGHILELHSNVSFEHSIPKVRVQAWGPNLTWDEARVRADAIAVFGGEFVASDMSAGDRGV